MPAAALLALALLAPASSEDVLARGEQVMRRFCLACHTLDTEGHNPLRPKLAPEIWGDPRTAYDNIGRLGSINSSMILSFQGSEEDRRALAAHLARLAAANRTPWWPSAVVFGAVAAGVAAALAWMRRARGQGASAGRAPVGQ